MVGGVCGVPDPPFLSDLQGSAGEREEEEGSHGEGEAADGAGEAGADDEAVPV